jgi:hypothetical protein
VDLTLTLTYAPISDPQHIFLLDRVRGPCHLDDYGLRPKLTGLETCGYRDLVRVQVQVEVRGEQIAEDLMADF